MLLAALRYVIKTRSIRCLHLHPGPDEFCARCQADAAIAVATGQPTEADIELILEQSVGMEPAR